MSRGSGSRGFNINNEADFENALGVLGLDDTINTEIDIQEDGDQINQVDTKKDNKTGNSVLIVDENGNDVVGVDVDGIVVSDLEDYDLSNDNVSKT